MAEGGASRTKHSPGCQEQSAPTVPARTVLQSSCSPPLCAVLTVPVQHQVPSLPNQEKQKIPLFHHPVLPLLTTTTNTNNNTTTTAEPFAHSRLSFSLLLHGCKQSTCLSIYIATKQPNTILRKPWGKQSLVCLSAFRSTLTLLSSTLHPFPRLVLAARTHKK